MILIMQEGLSNMNMFGSPSFMHRTAPKIP